MVYLNFLCKTTWHHESGLDESIDSQRIYFLYDSASRRFVLDAREHLTKTSSCRCMVNRSWRPNLLACAFVRLLLMGTHGGKNKQIMSSSLETVAVMAFIVPVSHWLLVFGRDRIHQSLSATCWPIDSRDVCDRIKQWRFVTLLSCSVTPFHIQEFM